MSLVPSPPIEPTLLQLFSFWAKQCQNDLKFDVELSSGILKLTVCSGLCLDHRWELLFSRWNCKVRPNNVEMARNFICTLLMAVLKDLAVFI